MSSSMKSEMLKAGFRKSSEPQKICDCCGLPQHRCKKIYREANMRYREDLIAKGIIITK